MIWPGVVLVMAAYAVGTSAPGLIFGSSTMSTSGGTMLETLMRFTFPMPAASSALSNAFSGVPPSAVPAVTEAFVTCFQNIGTSLPRRHAPARRGLIPPTASRHHHWRESKTQAFFPCAAFHVLYNFSRLSPHVASAKQRRGHNERDANETVSQLDDRRPSRA